MVSNDPVQKYGRENGEEVSRMKKRRKKQKRKRSERDDQHSKRNGEASIHSCPQDRCWLRGETNNVLAPPEKGKEY